jgi:ABC-type uncharacterized transport system involved in gliding motility auxiliary subunit
VPGEIADLLREYAARSGGKIRVVQKDPAKAGISGKAEELGVAAWQIQVEEKNESTLATVYSGILVEYQDREAVIPLVFSLDTLEYDLSSRIRSLVQNTGRELGVIVGDARKQWHTEFALLNHGLYLSGFKVRLINPGDEIPGVPALFVLGGAEDLDEFCLRSIDRYIRGGGSALFAADGVFVESGSSLEARAVDDLGLLAMLANYGVVIRRALVLDRPGLTLSFQTRNENGTVVQSVRYPEWIGIKAANPGHPVSSCFNGLDLYWASPLELFPPSGVSGEVLFSSTDGAWLQTEYFVTNPNLVSRFEDEEALTSGQKILGVSLSGTFPGAFDDSPDTSESDGSGGKPSRIIVIGDSDFAGSMMRASRAEARNLEFLVRAAEWLSGDEELLSIRSTRESGRLDRIADQETKNSVMAFSRTLNTVIIPLVVIASGFFLCRKRKVSNRFLRKTD